MPAFVEIFETIPGARRGLITGSTPYVLDSKIGTAAMPAGVLVVGGATEDKCKVPAATGEITAAGRALGVSAYLPFREPTGDGVNEYEAGAVIQILKQGEIWVITEGAPALWAPCFVRFVAGAGGTQLGAFRLDADTASAVALPGTCFLSTAVTVNGITMARIRLNLPQ